ncbi:DUF2293 domain-containing protein [Sinorhizobium medicae]|nr:DUF2293 domain-containing protein [Sinorhizobium medicae]
MATFDIERIRCHIRRKHPGCPDFAVNYIAAEVAKKTWKKATIGKAVGITMQNILRHEMTEYDSLLLSGEDRKTARKKAQSRINAILAIWSKQAKTAGSSMAARSVDEG